MIIITLTHEEALAIYDHMSRQWQSGPAADLVKYLGDSLRGYPVLAHLESEIDRLDAELKIMAEDRDEFQRLASGRRRSDFDDEDTVPGGE